MSGRSLHLRDGELITNRKTDRRQRRARPLLERLNDLNDRYARRYPTRWVPDVRVGFLLPKDIAPFVASGQHGIGVVVHRGFVQITHGSAEQCFMNAAAFFKTIARQRPTFTVVASVISSSTPGRHYGRFLTVVGEAMVVSGGMVDPRVYEARAA